MQFVTCQKKKRKKKIKSKKGGETSFFILCAETFSEPQHALTNNSMVVYYINDQDGTNFK